MLERSVRGAVLLSALILLVLAGPAEAKPASPYPKWTGARLYTPSGTTYARLAAHLETLEKTSRQTYTVVVVESSGSGDWATRSYCDALYRRWTAAHPSKKRLTNPRYLLIVLALENRQLAVRAGATLQSSHGLWGQAIDRTYVRPHFIPHAKTGAYETGLIRLVDAFEKAISGRDGQKAKRDAAEAKRRKDTAERAAKEVEGLDARMTDAQTALGKARDGGFDVADFERRLKSAALLMSRAKAEVSSNPTAALQTAISARRMISEVRSTADALQVAAETVNPLMTAMETELRGLADGIAELEAQGYSGGDLRAQLKRVEETFASAQAARTRRPQNARELLGGLTTTVARLQAAVDGVPERHSAWRAERDAAVREHRDLEATVDAGKEEGADIAAPALESARIGEGLRAHGGDAPASYTDSMIALRKARMRMAALRASIAQEREDHRFWTHDVPRYAGMAIAGLLLLFMLVRFIIRAVRKRRVMELLNGYDASRARAEEHLDTLRTTHRQLTLTDPDFTVSLRGETRRVYDHIGAAFDDFRRRYRRLGESWDEARDLVEREGLLSWKRLDEAHTLLLDAVPPSVSNEIKERCELPLEQLDQAHETARAAQTTLAADIEQIESALAEVQEHGLSVRAYEPTHRALARQLEDGTDELKHDPLGVAESFNAASADAAALRETAVAVVALLGRAVALEQREAEITADEQARRAEGFRFVEYESDPGPFVSNAAEERRRAIDGLNAGDPAAAAAALERAEAQATAGAEAIRLQVEGRALCREGIPRLRAERTRLDGVVESTRPHMRALESDFAPESWDEVDEAVVTGEETLELADRKLDEAASESTDDVQRYAHAAVLVRETETAFTLLETQLERVVALRAELEALREASRARLQELEGEGERLSRWFAGESRDRPPANQRLERALGALRRAHDRGGMERPGWPAIAALLDSVAAGFARAEEMAAEDLRLAAAAAAQIDSAAGAIGDADRYYGHGVSADLGDAEDALARAQEALARQDYEEAVVQAGEAEDAAEEAESDAYSRLAAKRRAERRAARRSAAASSGWSIMGSGGSSSSSSSGFSSWSSGGSSFGGSSGTSSSSWSGGSSGTSQSSW